MVPTHGLPWPLGHSPKFMYATRPATALRRARPDIPYISHASRFGLFVPGAPGGAETSPRIVVEFSRNKTPRVRGPQAPLRFEVLNGAGHRGSSSHGEQRGRSELARRAARQARLAAPPAAPEAGARRRSHWLSLSGAAQAASLHSSTRLLPARATQLSAARPAMRGSRSAAPTTAPEAGARWPRHWLSQSGAAQAASLHFSARLLPARATQLSAARPAMRRSGSVAPPTAPASRAGWPRHWLSQSSSRAAQAALLHFSARLLPARATQLSAARLATRLLFVSRSVLQSVASFHVMLHCCGVLLHCNKSASHTRHVPSPAARLRSTRQRFRSERNLISGTPTAHNPV